MSLYRAIDKVEFYECTNFRETSYDLPEDVLIFREFLYGTEFETALDASLVQLNHKNSYKFDIKSDVYYDSSLMIICNRLLRPQLLS